MPVKKNQIRRPEPAPQGASPLHLAAQLGKPELVSLLLELEAAKTGGFSSRATVIRRGLLLIGLLQGLL